MCLHGKAAAPMALGSGGDVVLQAVTAADYSVSHLNATDLAATILGARLGLTECMARVVCELAGIGGRT